MTTRSRVRALVGPLGLALLAGCIFAGDPYNDEMQRPDGAAAPPSEIQIEVENQNFYDATVYASHAGMRQRIGTVNGNSNKSFSLRWSQHEIAFEVHLIGGGNTMSSRMAVSPGDVIELTLPPDLHRMTVRRE